MTKFFIVSLLVLSPFYLQASEEQSPQSPRRSAFLNPNRQKSLTSESAASSTVAAAAIASSPRTAAAAVDENNDCQGCPMCLSHSPSSKHASVKKDSHSLQRDINEKTADAIVDGLEAVAGAVPVFGKLADKLEHTQEGKKLTKEAEVALASGLGKVENAAAHEAVVLEQVAAAALQKKGDGKESTTCKLFDHQCTIV